MRKYAQWFNCLTWVSQLLSKLYNSLPSGPPVSLKQNRVSRKQYHSNCVISEDNCDTWNVLALLKDVPEWLGSEQISYSVVYVESKKYTSGSVYWNA